MAETRQAPDEYLLVCEDCETVNTEQYLTTARDLVRGHREHTGHNARLEVPVRDR